MMNLGAIIGILLGIGFLVAIHEFGHFLVAKRAGVRVEIFSIGFGPALFRARREGDDTEYRISLIPLGGYVKLAGELPTPQRQPESHELWAKPPWQKFAIFAAGAAMNILVAFPLCVLVWIVGKKAPAPVVGRLAWPEAESDMKLGDRIVSVNGNEIRSLEEYRLAMVAAPNGTEMTVVVDRPGEGLRNIPIKAAGSEKHMLAPPINLIVGVASGKQGAALGFQEGDEIRAVSYPDEKGGVVTVPIHDATKDYVDALRKAAAGQGKSLTYTLGRGTRSLQVQVPLKRRTIHEFPADERFREPLVGGVAENSPARKARLERGDRIVEIEGKPIKCWADLKEAIRTRKNQRTALVIQRQGEEIRLTLTPEVSDSNEGRLGIEALRSDAVADVTKGGFWDKAGLRPGDRIKGIGKDIGQIDTDSLYLKERATSVFSEEDEPGAAASSPLTVRLDRKGETVILSVHPEEYPVADDSDLGIRVSRNYFILSLPPGRALARGLVEPWEILKLTVNILIKLVSGQESTRNIAGPVGIMHVSFVHAEQGIGNFLWLLAVISVNLGVMNLLPLPLLDGGHMWILLVYEKLRGKLPSERFLAAFQYAGIAFFLIVLFFVTTNDLHRLFTGLR